MTIYISGAVTGMPNNNKQAFKNAYSAIAEASSTILNSYKLDYTHFPKIINPLHVASRLRRQFSAHGKEAPEWADYMRTCIKKLCEADCVFFLSNWAQSEGASMEHYIAKKLKTPIAYNMNELKKIIGAHYGN